MSQPAKDQDLGEIEVPATKHDLDPSDRYQQFSSEMLRLSLLRIAGVGFLIANVLLGSLPKDTNRPGRRPPLGVRTGLFEVRRRLPDLPGPLLGGLARPPLPGDRRTGLPPQGVEVHRQEAGRGRGPGEAGEGRKEAAVQARDMVADGGERPARARCHPPGLGARLRPPLRVIRKRQGRPRPGYFVSRREKVEVTVVGGLPRSGDVRPDHLADHSVTAIVTEMRRRIVTKIDRRNSLGEFHLIMETTGIEPATSCLQSRRSPD
jgi:hypothetical protein